MQFMVNCNQKLCHKMQVGSQSSHATTWIQCNISQHDVSVCSVIALTAETNCQTHTLVSHTHIRLWWATDQVAQVAGIQPQLLADAFVEFRSIGLTQAGQCCRVHSLNHLQLRLHLLPPYMELLQKTNW